MKVLVLGSLAHSLVNFRGLLLEAMVKSGHEVSAWSGQPDDSTISWLHERNISFQELPLARAKIDPQKDLQLLYFLTRQMRKLKPDVVFSYTIKPVIYGSLAARMASVPSTYSLITGLGYALMGQTSVKRKLLRKLNCQMYRTSLANNRMVFFQNPDDLGFFIHEKILPSAEKTCRVNGSGVDLAHYRPLPIPAHPLRFLLIARLLYDKGIVEYIQAARELKAHYPDVRFGLLGPIDPNPAAIPMKSVQQWVKEGVIEYYGKQSDVRPYLAQSSVYVLPSYREGTPRSVLEAMATGRPVITTQAPGCRETVQHGRNGFLIPVRSVRPLIAAMEQFIQKPALLASMGQESLQLARDKFDVHHVNRILLDRMELS